MATEKQIAANRANAAKGGPKTQEGKDRCKMNALKHGFTARTVIVLPTENKEDFQHLRQGLVDSFHPQSMMELTLVEKLSVIQWKWNRKEAAEAGLLWAKVVEERYQVREACEKAGKSYDHVSAGQFLGLNFLKTKNPWLEKFLRYAASIDREFHKTLDELLRLIKLRDNLACPKDHAETADPGPSASSRGPAESAASNEIGTVPQNAPIPVPATANHHPPENIQSPERGLNGRCN